MDGQILILYQYTTQSSFFINYTNILCNSVVKEFIGSQQNRLTGFGVEMAVEEGDS